jgi:hypothetical protein
MTFSGRSFVKVNNMNRSGSEIVKKGFRGAKSIKFKKLDLLLQELETLAETSFTGYVKINYSQGSIGRVEKFEEILKESKNK